jgi:hypothetical protein
LERKQENTKLKKIALIILRIALLFAGTAIYTLLYINKTQDVSDRIAQEWLEWEASERIKYAYYHPGLDNSGSPESGAVTAEMLNVYFHENGRPNIDKISTVLAGKHDEISDSEWVVLTEVFIDERMSYDTICVIFSGIRTSVNARESAIMLGNSISGRLLEKLNEVAKNDSRFEDEADITRLLRCAQLLTFIGVLDFVRPGDIDLSNFDRREDSVIFYKRQEFMVSDIFDLYIYPWNILRAGLNANAVGNRSTAPHYTVFFSDFFRDVSELAGGTAYVVTPDGMRTIGHNLNTAEGKRMLLGFITANPEIESKEVVQSIMHGAQDDIIYQKYHEFIILGGYADYLDSLRNNARSGN